MKTVVVAFNYVDFDDPKKKERQLTAMKILAASPSWVFPIAYGLREYGTITEINGISTFNVLKRNSKTEIGNHRDLPYIKEILNWAAMIECGKIGYINSDILVGDEFYRSLQEDADAYIFPRSDIVETSSEAFMKGGRKVIYGGDQHIGADGFFFDRQWWINNRDKFPDDLIIGETEWDTCYRILIARHSSNYIESRVLYHVYHNAKWTTTSPGAVNNVKIWEQVKCET